MEPWRSWPVAHTMRGDKQDGCRIALAQLAVARAGSGSPSRGSTTNSMTMSVTKDVADRKANTAFQLNESQDQPGEEREHGASRLPARVHDGNGERICFFCRQSRRIDSEGGVAEVQQEAGHSQKETECDWLIRSTDQGIHHEHARERGDDDGRLAPLAHDPVGEPASDRFPSTAPTNGAATTNPTCTSIAICWRTRRTRCTRRSPPTTRHDLRQNGQGDRGQAPCLPAQMAAEMPGRCRQPGTSGRAAVRLDPFVRSQWKSARTTNAIERLHEGFKRRIKAQPCFPQRRPRRCYSGRRSPQARSSCARSMVGRRSPRSSFSNALTWRLDPITSPAGDAGAPIFTFRYSTRRALEHTQFFASGSNRFNFAPTARNGSNARFVASLLRVPLAVSGHSGPS